MHIYHYAAYEVSAVRRLSTRHNTRQDEVDELLRREVFVDLYQTVRHGLRIGEDSYSLKSLEHLYRPARTTEVATAAESIVQYARWLESRQPRTWQKSPILQAIRDYNEDDCKSTAGLLKWLREVAASSGIVPSQSARASASAVPYVAKELPPEVISRVAIAQQLAERADGCSVVLADLIDFHRREEKPMWWRKFDRAKAAPEELWDDSACIEGVKAIGVPESDKRSLVQSYRFDPSQECKLAAGSMVMFTHDLDTKLTLTYLDAATGELKLRLGNACSWASRCEASSVPAGLTSRAKAGRGTGWYSLPSILATFTPTSLSA
jgi:uncharacterized protein